MRTTANLFLDETTTFLVKAYGRHIAVTLADAYGISDAAIFSPSEDALARLRGAIDAYLAAPKSEAA